MKSSAAIFVAFTEPSPVPLALGPLRSVRMPMRMVVGSAARARAPAVTINPPAAAPKSVRRWIDPRIPKPPDFLAGLMLEEGHARVNRDRPTGSWRNEFR